MKYHFVRLHRKHSGMSQVAYAAKYQVTQALVSAIERGARTPPKTMAVDIVLAFPGQVSLGDLNPSLAGLIPEAFSQNAA